MVGANGECEEVEMKPFERAVEFVLSHEGGLVDDPRDPGGLTKYGISRRSYPDLDIANLTVAEATLIYQRDYWTLCQCDKLPSPLAVVLFDGAVNQGPSAAIRSLQESLGVKVDGVIGPATIAAATRCDIKKTLPLLVAERAVRYSKNIKVATFGRGWFRRLAACHQAALEPL